MCLLLPEAKPYWGNWQSLTWSGGPGSVVGIATGRYGARIPVEARFFAPVQTGLWAHPASCTMGTGSFPGVKSGRDVTLTPHSLLVPSSWKGRAILVLPLWAVQPVQGCTLDIFTLFSQEILCLAPKYKLYSQWTAWDILHHIKYLKIFL